MTEYRVRASGAIISDLASAFPDVSIPPVLGADDLNVLEIDPILEGPQPALTQFQSAQRSGPVQQNGQWMWVYAAVDWTQDAITATKNIMAANLRQQRDQLLADCDWTQLSDSPADKPAWATYRQALRDLTKQSTFPMSVTWPNSPIAPVETTDSASIAITTG